MVNKDLHNKCPLPLLISIQYTNVTARRIDGLTDGWTPHDGIGRAIHSVARQKATQQLLVANALIFITVYKQSFCQISNY